MIRIILADPNPTVRSALALLLETRLEAQIVGQVSSMESLLCEAAATQPHLIIMDWELPGAPAEQRIDLLRKRVPRAAIIAVSVQPESAAAAAQADAFVCKTHLPEQMLQAVRGVLSLEPGAHSQHPSE